MSVQPRNPGEAESPGPCTAELPAGFVEALFGRVSQDDAGRYDRQTLELFATHAFAHLRDRRTPGREDIRLTDMMIHVAGRPREVTVLEVVNDNMPFLLDSTLAELNERGLDIRFLAHPILAVERAEDGTFKRFAGEAQATGQVGTRRESLVQVHLDPIDDDAVRESVAAALARIYADVRVAVRDWGAMRGRVAAIGYAYRTNPPPLPADEVAEAVAFLDWLAADHFTLLGLRDYRYEPGASAESSVEGSGLGILADPEVKILRRGRELVATTPEIVAFLEQPVPLIVTKASSRSRVHRRVHLDTIGVKQYGEDGRLTGELRIVGLFTASAYTGSTSAVPFIRHKVAQVVRRAGFDPASYSGRALLNVLESYPRDELFQIDVDTLLAFSLEIMTLYERPRIRVLARADRFDRFVSLLVYIPKERFDSVIRHKVGEVLARLYDGRVSATYPAYPEGPLARTHYIIGRYDGETPRLDQPTLEEAVAAVAQTWADGLTERLRQTEEPGRARQLVSRYGEAFSAAYREAFTPWEALEDIAILEKLDAAHPHAVDIGRRPGEPATRVSLMLFSHGRSLPLSERVPLLEHLGFCAVSERSYTVTPPGSGGMGFAIHDMTLERAMGGTIDVERLEQPLESALMAVLAGEAESDGYNALVLEAGIGWRDVAALRTLSRYLQQARVPFSQDYMAATLVKHADAARLLVQLLHARFDPSQEAADGRATREADVRGRIESTLAGVTSLDEDRILRRFVNLIESAVRTSFFQRERDGRPREAIAFKFESRRIEGLPLPRPLYEIFLHSPRVEGVHLRFGKVARGGLRWSDRPQDFRTEILGLVKAQQVKNAVIVPVGAKGGFVPKRLPPPADRQAFITEGIAAYRAFVGTLLDITDNIDGDAVIAPADTVRHDGDDPYLVVAADKGTATFSDIANTLSIEHGHWLGDAFASGGSQGYDHKKMGITARGAWEAVKRHFRELGTDIQATPFSVVGVGDMSGDVFGNGMLLSPQIRLVAAFDHRDIFLDPTPDPAVSLRERQRLFDLPRSSWADYDKTLISTGGGVFPRSSKSIPLSEPVRAMLGLTASEATPNDVMRAILKARVDLLWFGGIGTYVRSSAETEEQAGDRANDAIRVTGADVGARVIGEGANLGVTQRGRIEAARRGVRLNTDAIDNSAGVNTSDVEVNIKIALAVPEADGRLDGLARNALLATMTDEVAALVLRNNYLQTLSLSLSEQRARGDLGFARRLMQALEAEGRLDRAVEELPDDMTLDERGRKGEGLTRPELAVLLAYAKLSLHDALLASRVPDDPYLGRELVRYFPATLAERYPDAIETHRLRREIVATQLANAIVNRGGPSVVVRLADQTGADAPAIAAAYAAVRDSYDLGGFNGEVDRLDAVVPGALQMRLYGAAQDLLLSRLVWFIRQIDWTSETLDAVVGRYREGIAAVESCLAETLLPEQREHVRRRADALVSEGAPEPLANRVASFPALVAAPDIVLVAARTGRSIEAVAASHFAVAGRFRLAEIALAARDVPVTDHYDRLALDGALSTIEAAHRALTTEVVGEGDMSGIEAVDAWAQRRGAAADRLLASVEAIAGSGLTLSKITVAASLLGDLARR